MNQARAIMISQTDLDVLFEYHAPTTVQKERMIEVRAAAKIFAKVILNCSPSSADQSTALRKLRECVMSVNQSIIFNGRY